MQQCSQKYTHNGKEYRCVRADGHSGGCIPTVLFEDYEHHIVIGMDFPLENGVDHSCVVTAERHEDGSITVLSVDEWDEQVHPREVPAGE